jgi:L-erythro-3,5-diaminohexanoate dehydrogenase
MFVGRVLEIGPALAAPDDVAAGDRIASLVSLTLTPLRLDTIVAVDAATGQVRVRGKAILFESGIYARLPDDLPANVALAVLDVAGAPAQVRRLARDGQTVCVIGADGKSGLLACAQARERAGASGRVVGIVPRAGTAGAQLLLDHGYVDHLAVVDARDALAVLQALPDALPEAADLVINCVNVAGTELASILCCRDGGTVYFFSMSTSFTAAALGAEGVGKDVNMMVGNGYAKGHAATALQTLRDHPPIHEYFLSRYSRPENS